MTDLKDLEAHGLQINDRVHEERLVCVLGDNLGSHWLGGFTTNFSTTLFICRYCLIQRNKSDSSSLAETVELRTAQNYQLTLDSATRAIQLPIKGIARQSTSNDMTFFHVCMPGLTPSLGHDLFEGVVQYDVARILNSLFWKKKEGNPMYIQHLNQAIKRFQFSKADGWDRPGVVSSGKTIGGHAVQNYCLIRLMPILLFDVVDVKDEVWQQFLLLREIVELVCAQKCRWRKSYI